MSGKPGFPDGYTITRPGLWVASGPACAGMDINVFYPPTGTRATEAKKICRACPVQIKCLQWALDNHERYGIWGGLTTQERRLFRQGKPVRATRDGTKLRLKGEITSLLPEQDRDHNRHGYSRYRNAGCRCERCKSGFAEYHRLYEKYRYATRVCVNCDVEYEKRGGSVYCSTMCRKIARLRYDQKRRAAA